MTARYFDIPFASSGDVATVPDAVQVDGSVSYTQGYGIKYSTAVSVGGINIERTKMNELFLDITTALQQYQQNGVPDYYAAISAGAGYAQYARVRYSGVVYKSLVNSNTDLPTVTTSWAPENLSAATSYVGGVSTGSAAAQVIAALTPALGFSTSNNGQTIAFTSGFAAPSGAATIAITSPSVSAYPFKKKGTGGSLVNLNGSEYGANETVFVAVNTTGACFELLDSPPLGTLAALNYDGTNFTASTGNLAFGSAPVLPSATTGTTQSASDNSTKLATTAYADRASQTVSGITKNLKINTVGATAAITCDEISLENGSNNYLISRAVNATVNTGNAAGLLGIDTGSWAANTWYYLWVISNGTLTSAIASLSSTAPTLPSGYTYKARVGAIRSSGTGTVLLATLQAGKKVQYVVTGSSPNAGVPVASSGVQGNISTPTYVSVAIGSYVPPTALAIDIMTSGRGTGGTCLLAPNNNYGNNTSSSNAPRLNATEGGVQWEMLLESTNIYWAANDASWILAILGWGDNL